MKVPKIFVPEKNLEKNLENILSKKFYMLNKERNKVMMYSLNGELLDSMMIGRCMASLEMFTFHNKKMLTAKFGDSSTQDNNRAIFDERLNPIIMTPSYPNQAYSVFERKNNPSLLMINTTAQRTKGTKITYYQHDSTKLDDFYYELHDVLSNKAFVLKTKEQSYLALCFNNHTLLIYEDLHEMKKLKTEPNINDVSVVNMKGEERVIALCLKDDGPAYQVLRIFDNKLKLLEELNTKDFKPTLPTDDPWHDKLIGFKTLRFGSQDYFFALIEKKSQKDRTDLKVLNTDFEAVLNIPNVCNYHVSIKEHNGRECLFIPESFNMLNVYRENFSLIDKIYLGDKFFKTPLKGGYKVVNFKETSYIIILDEDNVLNFYSDFPQDPDSWDNRIPNKKLKHLKDKDLKLKDITHFDYYGKDFLALEYWHNECTDIYDSNLKFVRSFPGGDFCIA